MPKRGKWESALTLTPLQHEAGTGRDPVATTLFAHTDGTAADEFLGYPGPGMPPAKTDS